MRTSGILAAICVLIGATANAGADQYTATLAQPVTKSTDLIIASNIWRCVESTCVLISDPKAADSVYSCIGLKHKVGSLNSYGNKASPFDTAKLEKCNASR